MKKALRNTYLFGISSLLNDISTELLQAILPYFLIASGFPYPLIGVIAGVRETISRIFMFLGGELATIMKKKKVVILGYSVSVVYKILLAFSYSWGIVLSLSLERIGKSLREAPRDSLISSYSKKHKAEMFGIHRTMDTLGAIVGVFLAYLFIEKLSYFNLFLMAGFIGLISLIPLFFVYEKKDSIKKSLKKVSKIKSSLKKFFIISFLFYLGLVSYIFLMIDAKPIFGDNGILLYLLFNIIYMFLSIPMGRIADNSSKINVISAGFIVFALSMLSFIFGSFYAVIIGFVLYGIGYAMIEGNKRAFVAELSSSNPRIFGIYYTLTGIATIAGNALFGALWAFGSHYAFFISSLFSVIAFILSMLWKKDLNHAV